MLKAATISKAHQFSDTLFTYFFHYFKAHNF